MSSNDLSLNHCLTSASTGQASPYISIQGTCTITGADPGSPFIELNGNLIIALSVQKNVLFGSESGRNLTTASVFSPMFQCGYIALSPPPSPEGFDV